MVGALAVLLCGIAVTTAEEGDSAAGVSFNSTQSSYMVLQQAPAKSAVYGMAPAGASLEITVASAADSSYSVKATATSKGAWLAYLKPAKDKDVTITAHCASGCTNTTDAVLRHVTFGDVWYCSGQSNMWLPMHFTYSRNFTVANITAGKYSNIRLMAGDSQHSNTHPWRSAKDAVNETDTEQSALLDFSAACWYFAEALTDEFVAAGKTPPTLGLINTAIGGSMIEEWSLNSTLATCQNTSDPSPSHQMLWDKNVVPYLSMTVKGFLWYQGENNMHGLKGNSLEHTGYGCMMPAMINLWRQHWSAEPGTTDPDAPFGLVALPGSGSEGGPNMGTMRWAQTANYGVLPNVEMNNTFLAQAFDLNDPWGDKSCYGMGCCNQYMGPVNPECVSLKCYEPTPTGNLSEACLKLRCPRPFNGTNCELSTKRLGLPSTACDEYCAVLHATPVFMGGIHPRLKRPVGERLAKAAYNQVYGGAAASTGPTISGCKLSSSTLTLIFDPELLKSSKVVVQPNTNATAVPTTLQVLTNSSLFCAEPLLLSENVSCPPPDPEGKPGPHGCGSNSWYINRYYKCFDGVADAPALVAARAEHAKAIAMLGATVGGVPPADPFDTAWEQVTASLGAAPGTVDIDVSKLTSPGTVVGVRYGWIGDCNAKGGHPAGTPDQVENCPIMSSEKLPANPFMAKIKGGKCECMLPQKCDA